MAFALQTGIRCLVTHGVCAGKEALQLHYQSPKQALLPLKLKSWPYPGRIGIREFNASSGRAEVHVFDYWCHLGTVDNEAGLDGVLGAHSSIKFDLDTYKLLLKEDLRPQQLSP